MGKKNEKCILVPDILWKNSDKPAVRKISRYAV